MTTKQTDFAWSVEHADELEEEYAGRFIAIAERKVVAAGDTSGAVLKEAKEQMGENVPILIMLVDSGDLNVHVAGSAIIN